MKITSILLPFLACMVFAFQPETQVRHVLVNRGELATFQSTTSGFTNFFTYTRNCRYVDAPCHDPALCPAVPMSVLSPLEITAGSVLELNIYLNPNDPYLSVADGFEIKRLWFGGVNDFNGDPYVLPNPTSVLEMLIDPGLSGPSEHILSFQQNPANLHCQLEIDVSQLTSERWLAFVDIVFFIQTYNPFDPNNPSNPNKMRGFFYNETENRFESVLRIVFDPEACHGDCTIEN